MDTNENAKFEPRLEDWIFVRRFSTTGTLFTPFLKETYSTLKMRRREHTKNTRIQIQIPHPHNYSIEYHLTPKLGKVRILSPNLVT